MSCQGVAQVSKDLLALGNRTKTFARNYGAALDWRQVYSE